MARFGENAVYGPVCVDGSLDSVFSWLALARRQFTGCERGWELCRNDVVARFGEKEAFGSRVLA